MITKTAWKNIWRNKVRSLVVIASVSVGIFAGAFSVAMMEGAMYQRLDDALNDEISHVQITAQGFRDNNDLACLMDNTGNMIDQVRLLEEVEAVSGRIMVIGMANTATKSTGVQIIGVDAENEKALSGLHSKIKEGTGGYLDPSGVENSALIGVDLAKSLNIIRYMITGEVIDSLALLGVPEAVTGKLRPYMDIRFKNEKAFKKELKPVFSQKEEIRYGHMIKEVSQSYREGARFTLTFIDREGFQTGGRFRIAGLYDIPNNMFESSQVFVLRDDLKRLTGLNEGENHMLMIRLKDVDDTREASQKIAAMFPDLETMNWREIQPDLAMLEQMAKIMYGMFMLIILAALAFGIVNTMLMVVLERTKELGMLTAIGMNKKKVFRLIMSESVFLSLFGGVIGMIISKIIISLTATRGINFASYQEGFEAMGYSAHIYPHIGNDFFVVVTLMIIITGILSAVYPALKALKLDPADALRTE